MFGGWMPVATRTGVVLRTYRQGLLLELGHGDACKGCRGYILPTANIQGKFATTNRCLTAYVSLPICVLLPACMAIINNLKIVTQDKQTQVGITYRCSKSPGRIYKVRVYQSSPRQPGGRSVVVAQGAFSKDTR